MATISITTRGMDKITQALQEAGQLDSGREVRGALSDAANLFATAARVTLPAQLKGTGQGRLLRSITARTKRRKPGALAGFRRSTSRSRRAAAGNHAHLVDRGTRMRKGRGTMPANHFWTDTVEANEARALAILTDAVKDVLDKALR